MVRPATEADITEYSEDYYGYVNQATLAANTPTRVLQWDLDKGEQVILEFMGTNGGANITLELRNKNDVIGEQVNGLSAPMMPRDSWYPLAIPMLFEEGDHMGLFATAAVAATNIKFFLKGHKVD